MATDKGFKASDMNLVKSDGSDVLAIRHELKLSPIVFLWDVWDKWDKWRQIRIFRRPTIKNASGTSGTSRSGGMI